MSDNHVAARLSAVHAPVAAVAAVAASAPAAAAPPSDESVGTAGWLREMREMRREQQKEREHQTEAFVGALDKLGARIDVNLTDLRLEMRKYLTMLVATFVLSFAVLGGLAGLTVYFKGLGMLIQTVPAAEPAVEPAPTP